jgi:hypothetical protein
MSFQPQFPSPGSGDPWLPADNGLLAANADPDLQPGTALLTAGTLYLAKLPARGTTVISNLWVGLATAGVGASTGSFLGLYSAAGLLLAQSADIDGILTGTTGGVAAALGVPQLLLAGSNAQSPWVALLANLATTQPTMRTGSGSAGFPATNLAPANYRFATNGAGLSALPASITPSANVTTAVTLWVGGS